MLRSFASIIAGILAILLWFGIMNEVGEQRNIGGIVTHGGPPYTLGSLLFDYAKLVGALFWAGLAVSALASWRPMFLATLLSGAFFILILIAGSNMYPRMFWVAVLASTIPASIVGCIVGTWALSTLKASGT